MGWLRSFVSPLKKFWDRLHSSHRKRNSLCHIYDYLFINVSFTISAGTGIYILYKDVKSCPCEDVHVLWSILVESHPAAASLQSK
ncbi:hypothetical protein NC651_014160 [Populus alba x Populus x berolinensis]|uniref:Uncharacterized protein n=1 Tax=Populus alba x Populus x berolinensis TaxID=444605 RepID=A0AAD6W417_9ROSI|nr:hypothetical protein NC651_014160 [Populus alba x Populus x berolinensis]KAJ6998415.1 hypothetical protein NC653_014563 [Populus alba x Populus x berolinensis]